MNNTKVYLSHQQRVIAERHELRIKYTALAYFVRLNPVFDTLDKQEQTLLDRQSDIMWEYIGVLDERIKSWSSHEAKY